jgi:integrase
MLALKWRDVNLDRATLQVRATLQYTAAGYVFAKPKTKRSRRHRELSGAAVSALRRHRARQEAERQRTGPGWTNLDLVFLNSLGKPLDNVNILRYCFRPLLQRAGLPPSRLRHTAATLLLSHGVNPKVASEMLGHSCVSITLDLYAHFLPHMLRNAADVMHEAMGPRRREKVDAHIDNELGDEMGSEEGSNRQLSTSGFSA